jgi:hypothetical protein
LDAWLPLQKFLSEATEQEVQTLIDHEVTTKKRFSILVRLHGRYNKLRFTRERAELIKACT